METLKDYLYWMQPLLLAGLGYAVMNKIYKGKGNQAIADATSVDISNFNNGLKYWQDIADKFKQQIDQLLPELDKLRSENRNLQNQIDNLDDRLAKAMNDKISLRGEVDNLNKIVKGLQVENTRLNKIIIGLNSHNLNIENNDSTI